MSQLGLESTLTTILPIIKIIGSIKEDEKHVFTNPSNRRAVLEGGIQWIDNRMKVN